MDATFHVIEFPIKARNVDKVMKPKDIEEFKTESVELLFENLLTLKDNCLVIKQKDDVEYYIQYKRYGGVKDDRF